MGRVEEARKSLAWASMIDLKEIKLPDVVLTPRKVSWSELFQHPRSLVLTWLSSSRGADLPAADTTSWAPTLFVLLLAVSPADASKMMAEHWLAWPSPGACIFSYLSDIAGRRGAGVIMGFAAFAVVALGVLLRTTSYYHPRLFGVLADGQRAELYRRERRLRDQSGPIRLRWPPLTSRATGMGSAYGFPGGRPRQDHRPAGAGADRRLVRRGTAQRRRSLRRSTRRCSTWASWYLLGGIVFFFIGLETKHRSIEEIDAELAKSASAPARKPATASGDD